MTGLPVSRLIKATVNLAPGGSAFANFDTLLIVGDSDVINVEERIREYSDLAAVAADFGTTAPEYLAASIFFGQTPQPETLFIGRWAQTATNGLLIGGKLTAAEQAMSNWTSITGGAFKVGIDGGALQTLSGLDFSAAANLNNVASVISAALTGAACAWSGSEFIITSDSTGVGSAVTFASSPSSGTDISAQLALTEAEGADIVDGIESETALEAVTELDQGPTQWYGLMFASDNVVDNDYLQVANYIEGATLPHIFGVTSDDETILDPSDDTDILSQLKALGYNRTFLEFSSTNSYAAAAIFGNAFTVNFDAPNSTVTIMYKVAVGVAAELLTETEASAIAAKNGNVFAEYNNGVSIIQYGKMVSGVYFDEVHGTDWLANRIEVDVFNLLFTNKKIPQTDGGNHTIGTVIEAACAAGVTNGLISPGVWNAQGFGQLQQGDFLPTGFYVFVPPISTQSQASRAARESVPITVAAKLAGAIHTVDILIEVNR